MARACSGSEDNDQHVSQFPFESLDVYQRARAFRRRIYKLAALLPDTERFNLASQMRSAARYLTNNIAEGHGRFTFKDRARFLHQARGSLTELMDDIVICADEGYAEARQLATLRPDALDLYQVISGYVRYLRGQSRSKGERESPRGAQGKRARVQPTDSGDETI